MEERGHAEAPGPSPVASRRPSTPPWPCSSSVSSPSRRSTTSGSSS
ncbi:hypothetical protein [Ornithinimicrobium kibberense]